MLVWSAKDPDEVAIRFLDWAKHPSWIEGDTIASSSFSLTTAAGMTVDASDDDCNHISQVTLSGGTAGSVGKALGQITTIEGQTLQQTATIKIESR